MRQIDVAGGEAGSRGALRRKGAARGDSPEERILRAGAEALSDRELLAALLGVAVTSAEQLLELQADSLSRLFAAGSGAAETLSPVRRVRFLAARELACRLAAEQVSESHPLRRPDDVARYLSLRYSARDQEILGALFLSSSGRLLQHREIYRGTFSRTSVEPREILKHALLIGAAGVILFHNHPGGEPTPSPEDIAFTRLVSQAATLLDIRLADHLILGSEGQWVSMRDVITW